MALFGNKDDVPSISFLSVGTKILTKDIVDQHIRSLGPHRTYYAPSADSGRKTLSEQKIDFLLLENDLPDSTGFRFLTELRAEKLCDAVYVVLTIESEDPALVALATEMDVNSIIVKPFTTALIENEILKYEKMKTDPSDPVNLLRKAAVATRDRMLQEAERLYFDATKAAPNDAHTIAKAGLFYLDKPDLELAEKFLYAAYQLNQQNILALSGLGQLFLRRKLYPRAFQYLNEAQTYSPLNTERPVLIARTLQDWAISGLKSASLKDPSDPKLQFELGRMLVFSGDFVGGMKALRQATIKSDHSDYKELQAMIKYLREMSHLK